MNQERTKQVRGAGWAECASASRLCSKGSRGSALTCHRRRRLLRPPPAGVPAAQHGRTAPGSGLPRGGAGGGHIAAAGRRGGQPAGLPLARRPAAGAGVGVGGHSATVRCPRSPRSLHPPAPAPRPRPPQLIPATAKRAEGVNFEVRLDRGASTPGEMINVDLKVRMRVCLGAGGLWAAVEQSLVPLHERPEQGGQA